VYVPSGLEDFADRAKASEMITGYYHFLVQSHASDHVSSGRMQADHFLRTIEGRGGIDDRLLCADFEAYNPPRAYLTPSNATLESFIASLRERVGEHPIVLYSGRGFWNGGTPSGAFAQYGADVAWDAMTHPGPSQQARVAGRSAIPTRTPAATRTTSTCRYSEGWEN
jgi:hypothetical protein